MAKSFWNRVKSAFSQPNRQDTPIETNDVESPANRDRAKKAEIHDFSEILTLNQIELDSDLTSQTEILKYLSKKVLIDNPEADQESLYGQLLVREQVSTNLGDGVALPHILDKGISQMRMYFIRLKKPVSWGEGQPVSIVIGLLAPKTEVDFEHVSYLAGVAELLLQKNVVNELNTAQAPERINHIFNQS